MQTPRKYIVVENVALTLESRSDGKDWIMITNMVSLDGQPRHENEPNPTLVPDWENAVWLGDVEDWSLTPWRNQPNGPTHSQRMLLADAIDIIG